MMIYTVSTYEEVDKIKAGELSALPVDSSHDSHQGLKGVDNFDLKIACHKTFHMSNGSNDTNTNL
jgi:hypothetical protein